MKTCLVNRKNEHQRRSRNLTWPAYHYRNPDEPSLNSEELTMKDGFCQKQSKIICSTCIFQNDKKVHTVSAKYQEKKRLIDASSTLQSLCMPLIWVMYGSHFSRCRSDINAAAKAWFKIAVSVVDSEDSEAHRYWRLGSVSGDTQKKILKSSKNYKNYF